MSYILLAASALLVVIGGAFGFAYIKRKKTNFDNKCNTYFIVSMASLITATTICVLEIGMVIASLI